MPLAPDLSPPDCQSIVGMYEPRLNVTDQPQHTNFPRDFGDTWPTMVLPPYRAGESELGRLELSGSDEPVDITVDPEAQRQPSWD